MSITAWGRGYYERTYVRYQELYPAVAAPVPVEQHDPQEPFIDIVQRSRTCRACLGEYLVEVARTYQQDRKWTWSVTAQEQRIAGEVTHRFRPIEQCACQETEIEEVSAPLLTLLDHCITHGWLVHFPYHSWYASLDYLVGGPVLDREKRWYDPALARQRLFPLLDAADLDEQRNAMKGVMCCSYNERIGKIRRV